MTVIGLVPKKKGRYSGNSIYYDKALEDTFLTINNGVYDDAHDRLYDVKGLEEIFAIFENFGVDSIDMLIQKTHKEFTNLADLTSLDFFEEVAEAAIAAGAEATGTVTLDTGASGSVDSIKVDGVEIMSGSVPFNTSLAQTATDVATNINAFTSDPNYTANAVAAVITITAVRKEASTDTVISVATTITTTDVNMSGGADGRSVAFSKTQLSPEITAIKFRFKETASGSPGSVRSEMGIT